MLILPPEMQQVATDAFHGLLDVGKPWSLDYQAVSLLRACEKPAMF